MASPAIKPWEGPVAQRSFEWLDSAVRASAVDLTLQLSGTPELFSAHQSATRHRSHVRDVAMQAVYQLCPARLHCHGKLSLRALKVSHRI
jgi:hypothetical protein